MKAGRGNIKYTFTTKTRDRQKKSKKNVRKCKLLQYKVT